MPVLAPLVLCDKMGINASNDNMSLEQEKAIRKVLNNDSKTAHLITTWQDV